MNGSTINLGNDIVTGIRKGRYYIQNGKKKGIVVKRKCELRNRTEYTEYAKNQPWLIPRSCGDICCKFLQTKCGNICVLLCHPGPYSPCPKIVFVEC